MHYVFRTIVVLGVAALVGCQSGGGSSSSTSTPKTANPAKPTLTKEIKPVDIVFEITTEPSGAEVFSQDDLDELTPLGTAPYRHVAKVEVVKESRGTAADGYYFNVIEGISYEILLPDGSGKTVIHIVAQKDGKEGDFALVLDPHTVWAGKTHYAQKIVLK